MNKAKSLVLQVGESIHTHQLESKKDFAYDLLGGDAFRFILDGKGVLRHEEHGPMVFGTGNYFKFPQVEYDPMEQNVRQVFD